MYTAKRKSDRTKMALAIATLARSYGAVATISPEHNRETAVSIEGPRGFNVIIEFDGTARDPDTFLLTWHSSLRTDARLADGFGDINPYHFQKATHIAYSFEDLQRVLRHDLAMLLDGRAFDAEREKAAIAKNGTWQEREAQWDLWRVEEQRRRDLEAFRATKRRVDDVQAEVGAVLYFGEGEEGEPKAVPGLIYRDELYIEERPNGQYYLILEREDWLTSDLADLEEKLFDWDQLWSGFNG